jgi:hypothetical protein
MKRENVIVLGVKKNGDVLKFHIRMQEAKDSNGIL